MSKLNILLDRELLDSAHIQSRQNFELILRDLRSIKQPLSSRAWFYGAVGTASVAIGVSVVNLDHIAKVKVQSTDSPMALSQAPKQKSQPLVEVEKPTQSDPFQKVSIVEKNVQESIKTIAESDPKQHIIPPTDRPARRALLPHVSGVYDGQIPVASFCETGKIECNHSDFIIKGFVFDWFDGSEDIRLSIEGNKLPDELCKNILQIKNKESVFITEIMAGKKDEEGTIILPSLHLELIP